MKAATAYFRRKGSRARWAFKRVASAVRVEWAGQCVVGRRAHTHLVMLRVLRGECFQVFITDPVAHFPVVLTCPLLTH